MELLVTADGRTKRLQVKKNENLMVVLLKNGLDISHPCRGKGKCGKCKVKVRPWDGITDRPSDEAPQSDTKELACLVKVDRPLAVTAPAKWNDASDPVSEQLFRGLPGLSLPFHRICVHIPPEAGTPRNSRWEHLAGAFHGKDEKVLRRAMEQVLPVLSVSLPPSGGPVTLCRSGRAYLGLAPGDTATRRVGAAILVEAGMVSGVLVDPAVPAILSAQCTAFKSHAGAPQEELHAVNALLGRLSVSAGIQGEEITDVVMAAEGTFLDRVSGFMDTPASQGSALPMSLGVRRMSATRLGLDTAAHAGVWMAPAASKELGSSLVVRDLAPYWVPVLAESFARADSSGIRQGQMLRGLSGLVGCLLHREIRQAAKRKAGHPEKCGKQA